MKRYLIVRAILGALASAGTVAVLTRSLDAAVRWGLYRAVWGLLSAVLVLQIVHLWFLFAQADICMECRSCGDMPVGTESWVLEHAVPFGNYRCKECGNGPKKKSFRLYGCMKVLFHMGSWVMPVLWGAVAARLTETAWWAGGLLFLMLQKILWQLTKAALAPPRRRRGLTPEGFVLDVEERQGFRVVMVCRGCGGRSVSSASGRDGPDPDNPPDARTPLSEDGHCPHCQLSFVRLPFQERP